MRRINLFFIVFSMYLNVVSGQQDLNKPFRDCKIEGSITLYDYNMKKWISSNINDSHYPTLPASTFKIINTLIALETGVIASQHEVVRWPGLTDTIKYGYRPNIYHDMSMEEAFKVSAGWAYIELAKRIGKEKYQQYLSASNYGNGDLSIKDADFWNFGKFAISPANQIEILVGIYEETLPFKKEYFKILKGMMVEEKTDDYILRAKTGWSQDDGKDIGWWVGNIELQDNVYFFATRLIKEINTWNPDFRNCRKKITREVLKGMDIIK